GVGIARVATLGAHPCRFVPANRRTQRGVTRRQVLLGDSLRQAQITDAFSLQAHVDTALEFLEVDLADRPIELRKLLIDESHQERIDVVETLLPSGPATIDQASQAFPAPSLDPVPDRRLRDGGVT